MEAHHKRRSRVSAQRSEETPSPLPTVPLHNGNFDLDKALQEYRDKLQAGDQAKEASADGDKVMMRTFSGI
jgi:hypothetical protein